MNGPLCIRKGTESDPEPNRCVFWAGFHFKLLLSVQLNFPGSILWWTRSEVSSARCIRGRKFLMKLKQNNIELTSSLQGWNTHWKRAIWEVKIFNFVLSESSLGVFCFVASCIYTDCPFFSSSSNPPAFKSISLGNVRILKALLVYCHLLLSVKKW